MKPFRAVSRAVKAAAAFVGMRFARGYAWAWGNLGATSYNLTRSVGDASTNAVIAACIRWMQRTFPEAKLVVREIARDGSEPKGVPDHPLAVLLRKPNAYYSGLLLWAATIADFALSGNAYWLKVRSNAGAVVELWWVPSGQIEPRWQADDPTVYIDHYDYTLDGTVTGIRPEDVVHFRDGIDPQNVRKGRSGVQSLLREIATDNEAANWTAAMLRNMGVPGVVISAGAGAELGQDDADEIKSTFMQKFGGDRKGDPLVLSAPASVSVVSFSPEQMQLAAIRRVPEERITAIFGLPAIVVGMGVGLEHGTYSNYAQAREAAYESNVIPTQRLFAEELQTQLVPDFGDAARLLVEYDYSDVRILQADVNELHARARADLAAGLLTRNQALAMIGEQADESPGGGVVFVPNNVTPMLPGDLLVPRVAPIRETITDPGGPLALPVGTNGHGGH